MIRAFAPGMTMQEPLPQTASNFDVRQEPTTRSSDDDLPAAASTPGGAESEVQRLEQLLVERTRERRDLAQELERRSALLRDACARLSELAPRVPELQLREERDAAVARAVQAEVDRAQAAFKLDEVLGQLLAVNATRGGRPAPAEETSGNDRVLQSRLLELEERKQMIEARLLLVEDQFAQEQARYAAAVRERVETAERFEFELSETRAYAAVAERQLFELRDLRSALFGERDGMRARLDESELALTGTSDRLARALHLARELQDKLDAERGERATHATRAQVEALRAEELEGARARDEEQLETLRQELDRERVARSELDSAARGHAAQLAELFGEVERERAARVELISKLEAAEARAVPESEREAVQQARLEALRACLLELRVPLVEFETSLTQIAERGGLSADETTLPGMEMDADAISLLDEQLRAKEARIEELEAVLRVAQQNEQAAKVAQAQERAERVPRDVSTLKGELIDVRANAARLSDDLAKERSRRRKMAVTVRALQAAFESGEAPGPWIEELLALINEGASVPPKV